MFTRIYRLFSGSIFALAVFASLTSPASAQQSRRHLVYSFTVGITNSSSEASSFLGNGGVASNGTNSYNANTSDKGQIAVDIQGTQQDGGLVVSASETAKDRNEKATTCVVYPTTAVACSDPNTNPEIMSVLRTLSPKFFNGSNLDANRHWKVSDPSVGLTIDFGVTPDANGLLSIASQRDQTFKGAHAGSIHATANYTYNPERYIPQSLKEYTIVREQTGPGAYSNITIDVTGQLASDSAGT